ncbi:hypothetical protein [uncultured Methanolobus sp.]|nr:hypothetical protein [uncultured Methanolobus sp.]
MTDEMNSRTGETIGTAYRLVDGSTVYVPY